MLVKNFYVALASWLTAKSAKSSGLGTTLKDVDGNSLETLCYEIGFPYRFSASAAVQHYGNLLEFMSTLRNTAGFETPGIYVGSGNTQPTFDDYKLEKPITSGFQLSSGVLTTSWEKDHLAINATVVIQNTGEESITVSEIGCFTRPFDTNNGAIVGAYPSSFTTKKPFLVDRTVLAAPIIVSPGEVRTCSYTIRFDYPTV